MKKIFITLFISALALGSASAQNEFKLGVELSLNFGYIF